MCDYTLISLYVITNLQEGSKESHRLLWTSNMAPSPQCPTYNKLWYEKPCIVERTNPKSLLIHLVHTSVRRVSRFSFTQE